MSASVVELPAPVPTIPRRRSARPALAVVALLVVLALAVLLSLAVGAVALSPTTVWQALTERSDLPEHAIVWDGRVPRTLLGLVAGAALGIAGALIQAITRNPLADPGVLGVNAGAALAIVVAAGFGGVSTTLGYVWAGFVGALAATVAVYLVGTGGRLQIDPVRLTLAGVAIGALLTGIGSGLALLRPEAFDRLRSWTIGTLDVRSLSPAATICWFVLAGLVLAALSARGLNAVALGEDLATALGASVLRARVGSVLAITLLAGSATAAAGSIGFVGLMVPHLARRIAGPDQRWIIALSALIAPVLMLLCDVIGRVVVAGELPVGVVTAFVGAPVLIVLARRSRLARL